jgi:hypothetical protein
MAEKNIIVNRGIPLDSGNGPGFHSDVPYGYGLGSRGEILNQDFDGSDTIAAWLQTMWAEEAAAAAREAEAVSIIAAEVARRDAEAADRAADQRARELAQAQADSSARQSAEDQARDEANKLAQRLMAEANLTAQKAALESERRNAEDYIKHASDAGRLWSTIASPNTASTGHPKGLERATEIAKKLLIRKAAATLGRQLPLLAALYPSDLAPSELAPAIFTTPASELGVSETDLGFVAGNKGTTAVTHRLMPSADASDSRVEWREVDGVAVGSQVRVRPAVYDPVTNTYNFTRDGESTPTLTWTPQQLPDASSTSLPSAPQSSPLYTGGDSTPARPQHNIHPEHTVEPDDYIVPLPAELGLGSAYIYFKNPRQIAGVASGYGSPVQGTWLGDKTRTTGAPVPAQIANQLRGQRFKNFDRFREAFWEAVAADAQLGPQLSSANLSQAKRGKAPYPQKNDQVGGRDKFEIHHVDEVGKGGAVYDMDNIVIMTPAQHIEYHKGE